MANYTTTALKLSDSYVNAIPFGVCSTAASTAAKVVDAGTFALNKGAMVVVQFTVTNTAASPTLNVSSTGAKAIYYRNAAISKGYLAANRVYQFIYDGSQWELIGDIDTNTTYTSLKNPKALTVQGNGTTSATYDGSAAKTVNIKAGTNVSVSADTSGNITVSATDTTYSAATTSAAGLMSAADKTKLNGIATGANNFSLPTRLAAVQASSGAITDPNAALETGFYYVSSGDTNRPPFSQSANKDYRLLVTAYGATWLQQIATDFRCDDIFYRRLENGTWKPWVKIYPVSHTHTASYTPAGSVSKPGITLTKSAVACDDITAWSAGSLGKSVTNQNLTLTFTAPSLSYTARSINNVTAAALSATPTFTGTAATITTNASNA